MIEKLRSHLHKSEKDLSGRQAGFTLIELLVVIAIIAVLVTIVLVAINPIARINEANQRDGQSRVRQVAGGVEACLTSQEGQGSSEVVAAAFCGTAGGGNLTAAPGNYLKNIPGNVNVCVGTTVGTTDNMVGVYTTTTFGGNTYAYKTGTTGGHAQGNVYNLGAAYSTCDTLLGL